MPVSHIMVEGKETSVTELESVLSSISHGRHLTPLLNSSKRLIGLPQQLKNVKIPTQVLATDTIIISVSTAKILDFLLTLLLILKLTLFKTCYTHIRDLHAYILALIKKLLPLLSLQ